MLSGLHTSYIISQDTLFRYGNFAQNISQAETWTMKSIIGLDFIFRTEIGELGYEDMMIKADVLGLIL